MTIALVMGITISVSSSANETYISANGTGLDLDITQDGNNNQVGTSAAKFSVNGNSNTLYILQEGQWNQVFYVSTWGSGTAWGGDIQGNSNNLKFEQGDATKYGKKDQFDVIVSFETIEHVSAYKDVIKNFYKLLKADGMLYISSPNRMVTSPGAKKLLDKPKNKYHTQEFLPNELSELLVESGFKIKDIYGQRYFYYSKNTIINKVINKILRPAYISSPSVSLLRKYLQPRYFIIEAIRD